ncbi:hypothetical protein GOP47_0024251 [Adiantum capillus-veneris]|uniref:Uncharacterized protein n=1 Tax=Adiantum capillus-veneris TaxID=13818 RepID=A0A9D4U535_ADICA|nr:hypothetical protein GOP47_0024251 [Adiantum capillus-veneris]
MMEHIMYNRVCCHAMVVVLLIQMSILVGLMCLDVVHVEAAAHRPRGYNASPTQVVVQNESVVPINVTVNDLMSMVVDTTSNVTLLLSSIETVANVANITITNLLTMITASTLDVPLDALTLANLLITPSTILNFVNVFLPSLDINGVLTFLTFLI